MLVCALLCLTLGWMWHFKVRFNFVKFGLPYSCCTCIIYVDIPYLYIIYHAGYYSPTSIIRTLHTKKIMRSKYNKVHMATFEYSWTEPDLHEKLVRTRAYASRLHPPCVWVLEFVLLDNTQASTMASRKRKQIILFLFQLSELFTYPNDNDFGDGQRGSDNRGWTVVVMYGAPQPSFWAIGSISRLHDVAV